MSGYILYPRRAQISVKHYEMLACLNANMRRVYIDEKSCVKEFKRREKEGWGGDDDREDVAFINEERNYARAMRGEQELDDEEQSVLSDSDEVEEEG